MRGKATWLDKFLSGWYKVYGVGGKLYIISKDSSTEKQEETTLTARRQPIPDEVKIFVWRRDEGKCVKCGSQKNLEFDHIIPLSKGGSNTARNIQILCETCNRSKGDSSV